MFGTSWLYSMLWAGKITLQAQEIINQVYVVRFIPVLNLCPFWEYRPLISSSNFCVLSELSNFWLCYTCSLHLCLMLPFTFLFSKMKNSCFSSFFVSMFQQMITVFVFNSCRYVQSSTEHRLVSLTMFHSQCHPHKPNLRDYLTATNNWQDNCHSLKCASRFPSGKPRANHLQINIMFPRHKVHDLYAL